MGKQGNADLLAAHPFLIKISFPFSPDRVLTSPNQYRRNGVKAFSKDYLVHDWHQDVRCVCKTRKRNAIHLRVSGPVISLRAPKWGLLQTGAGWTCPSAVAGKNACPTSEIEKSLHSNSYLMNFWIR
jgi:hypothetical protein